MTFRRILACGLSLALLASAETAFAQRGRRPPPPPPSANGDDAAPPPGPRMDPEAKVPDDPLAVPKEVGERIGSDDDGRPPSPVGEVEQKFRGYYEESRGDYKLRLVPPLYLEHTRSLPAAADKPAAEDTEGLYGMLYYRRRSPKIDVDTLFPLAWRLRDGDSRIWALGPLAHREAPQEHDNWVAPLVFEGERKDGGYLHVPALLLSSRWSEKSAFTVAGPYFRDRTGSDVDWGVAPLLFRGNNGDEDGARKTYTLIPPLAFYRRERELDNNVLTVAGPLIWQSSPKRESFFAAPLFFRIKGKPETGGIRESHTTLFPFFHYGESDEQKLFVLPGMFYRTTKLVSTFLTPFYSHATTRAGRTDLTAIGPIAPLYYRYRDLDLGASALGIFPFYYGQQSPTSRTLLTPLFARMENVGVSRTYWAFPNITVTQSNTGWETDIHPIVYAGREQDRSHLVVAPIFWDFASKKGRTTIGFPAYWRFADTEEQSVVQVAANTLYLQKRVAHGLDWSFHVLPVFSYGENPSGYFWNVLFGLAGYERSGDYGRVKALWVPITVDSPKQTASGAQ